MERNKTNRKQKLKKKIKYIFSKTNEYTLDELYGLDYNDVVEIYEEIKERNKPIIFKLFRFLFFGY